MGDAGLAVLVLLVTTTLSVYKPWGRTPYGRRMQQQEEGDVPVIPMSLGRKIVLAIIGVIVAAFVVLHLAGGGLHHGW